LRHQKTLKKSCKAYPSTPPRFTSAANPHSKQRIPTGNGCIPFNSWVQACANQTAYFWAFIKFV